MINKNKLFEIEDVVYLITDPEQLKRIVTQITETKADYIYQLSCASDVSWHYDFEITKEKNIAEYI